MKVITTSPVYHDGQYYEVGTTVDALSDDQGAALVAAGAAIEVIEEVKRASKKAEA